MPYSSAVCETKAIGRRGRTPASTNARASASVTATPLASSKAPPNQPSWWPATTEGAPPPRRPGSTPTTFAAAAPRLRNAAEGGALVPPPARLDERVAQPPGIDRHGLLDDLEAEPAQLLGDERDRRLLLRRPRHSKAQRVRAERLQPLDDQAQVPR